jgi:histidyl-tRNA synthetase
MDYANLNQSKLRYLCESKTRPLKPSTPKGTRDFLPAELAGRNYIFHCLREIFTSHGYQPIETPAMETLETLTGKYGDEGDRLIFKILNSGNFLSKVEEGSLVNLNSKVLAAKIAEKALRYDLTVPFARYVVEHRNEITFPFKRYQIQPVWRADRPQKGRYREFYQCDVDVIGSDSLINEIELIQIIDTAFQKLCIQEIKIGVNNRKILVGIAQVLGIMDQFSDFVTALDKWDKVGDEGVKKELIGKGFDVNTVRDIIVLSEAKDIAPLRNMLVEGIGKEGLDELEMVLHKVEELGIGSVCFNPRLARGLDYYTGIIIEVTATDSSGSICAGGRYDDLTGVFGMKDVSGVGISFGADRIYDLMKEKDLLRSVEKSKPDLMFVNFGEDEAFYCFKLMEALRISGVNCELYPDNTKIKKQLAYANAKGIDYVVMAGSDEIRGGKVTLRDMSTGEQRLVTAQEMVSQLTGKG